MHASALRSSNPSFVLLTRSDLLKECRDYENFASGPSVHASLLLTNKHSPDISRLSRLVIETPFRAIWRFSGFGVFSHLRCKI